MRFVSWAVIVACSSPALSATPTSPVLTFEERVAARRAVEEVYWQHRIWPPSNPGPKPTLDEVLPDAVLRARVEDGLRKSEALGRFWGRPLGRAQIQAEIDRIARASENPAMLREILDALGNDPTLFAEVVVRPALADRLARTWHASDGSFDAWWAQARGGISVPQLVPREQFVPPDPHTAACTDDTWQTLKAEPPEPRAEHVGVWTGSEMLVWGGQDGFRWGPDGARYDPATDTWTAMSYVNGPGARAGATGVWTGTELIVWGGAPNGTGGAVDTGARYNPVTDTWAPTPSSGSAFAARSNASAVWTGGEIIYWGGGSYTGARFNPATGVWTAIADSTVNVPLPRSGNSAVWTGQYMVIYAGVGAFAHSDGGRYDPVSNSWLPVATGPIAGSGHSTVWTGSRMIVWGGSSNVGGIYDPVANTWTATSTGNGVPTARSGHTAVWTGTRMIVWGGSGFTLTGGIYDPASDSWTATVTTGAPSGRFRHTAVWTGSEMVVWGGMTVGGQLSFRSGGRFRPTTNSWVPTSAGTTVPTARARAGAAWTGAEVIVVGGLQPDPTSSGGRYDPALDAWTPIPNAPAVSGDLSGRAVWTGVELFVGGSPAARYDPQANVWRSVATALAPSQRSGNALVWTGSRVVVWGGNTSSGNTNTGGRYDPAGNAWTPTSVSGAVPAARRNPVSVWTGSRALIWGGIDINTGALYDPVADTWTTMTAVGGPDARRGAAGVWTGSRFFVWGGQTVGGGSGLNTGGLYDPTTDGWTSTSTGAGVPSGRFDHGVTWDGSRVIVWGGSNFTPLGTGARYDPVADTWTPMATTGAPYPRSAHVAVRMDRQTLVYGGDPYNANGARYCSGACTPSPWYRDQDGDGYGTEADIVNACDPPAGYVASRGDCNELSEWVNPAAGEICNSIDDDCDLATDEGFDVDGDGFTSCGGDCDDQRSSVRPGAPQICDGRNNDCLDPAWPALPPGDLDADGDGVRVCNGDCNDGNSAVRPNAPQVCDGVNNNCNDPSWPLLPPPEFDADGDGYRVCQNDCNDGNANINPGHAELCNTIDDDCDTRVDEDASNAIDGDADGIAGACDNCPQVSNANQLDTDGDLRGNACDNCIFVANANQADVDNDTRGDSCDNCVLAPNATQDDFDVDRVGDACDNCPTDFNASQSNVDADGEGDICDLNDGLIYLFTTDPNFVEWQQETGPTSFNVYEGSLAVLRSSGVYTQAPGSNPLAEKTCGVADPYLSDLGDPSAGDVKFSLVTGVTGGVEGSLGTNSAGAPRSNTNPCP
jgi:putative metal-binding protein